MKHIYSEILKAKSESRKLLAILIDPDKFDLDHTAFVVSKINNSPATHILVGGSLVFTNQLATLIIRLKENTNLPIILFPGSPSQISLHADGILFLSLISGRNPNFLIGHHIKAAPMLKAADIEIIPTGYILIESGESTAVETVSETAPLAVNNQEEILHTAQAGEMLGNKLIYLEAGSGASNPVPNDIIEMVSRGIEIPLIVGGGITSKSGIETAYKSGADMVVIGTAFENDHSFFEN